jgi:hypothetical protein
MRVHENVRELWKTEFNFRPIVFENGSVNFTDIAEMAKRVRTRERSDR